MKFRILIVVVLAALLVMPATAQEDTTYTVDFSGISFSFDAGLASGVNINVRPGDPIGLEQPGGPYPPATEFTFAGYQAFPDLVVFPMQIVVMNTADFEQYGTDEFSAYAQWQNLLGLLGDPMAAASLDRLPVLPLPNASQVFVAQVDTIETENLSGIRYLTAYAQDASPLLEGRVQYSFQGVSADGAYYVSVQMALDTGVLPDEMPEDMDWDAFNANYEQYVSDLVAELDAQAPEAFNPTLGTLDALVSSISVAPGAVVGAGMTTSDELANTAWQLVSLGGEAVPAEPQIFLNFEPLGQVFGNDGCNSIFGSYTLADGSISFGMLGSTMMACEQAVMDQANAFTGALQTASSYSLGEGQLVITTDSGELVFAPLG